MVGSRPFSANPTIRARSASRKRSATRMSASGRTLELVANAASSSGIPVTFTMGSSFRRSAEAASCVCFKTIGLSGLVGFARKATRESPGTTSLSSSSRFPSSSWTIVVEPVTFPPGRARLATSPVPTASPATAMTIGIVFVACLAARAPGVPAVTIASTLILTRSETRAGKRSYLPSAHRYSMVMF